MQVADGLYHRLEPEERFRAAVEAFARRDVAEIDRLNDTCPTQTVRVQCPAYFGRLRGFHELAMLHGIFARDLMIGIWACLGKLARYSDAERATDSFDSTHVEAAVATENLMDVSHDEDQLVEVLGKLVGRLKAHRASWAEFCESVCVDPSKTLFAYYEESMELAELFDDFEADAEYQTELLGSLKESWALRIERRS